MSSTSGRGTPFNDLQHPTDIVLLTVLWRLRYKLSFRDVAEMLLQRGLEVTHETFREWEFRFAPLLSERLRAKRRGRAGGSSYVDETYVQVAGRWCYLYRAIAGDGVLIDSMLSERREACCTEIPAEAGRGRGPHARTRHDGPAPGVPAGDSLDHRPRALHRTTQYLNNYTEQSHRAVKQCYYPMLGFGNFESASGFCSAFDELRQYFRVRRQGDAHVSLAEQRRLFVTRWRSLIAEAAAA